MKTLTISGKLREETGKSSSKQLRKSENVPCVIYGGEENIHFHAHRNSFKNLIYTPDAHIVNLDLEGKTLMVVMKDIQFHPVTDEIMHIDFVEVFENKPVVIDIPLKITGDSPGVKAGGKLRIKLRKLKVKGLMSKIPDFLVVDISSLNIGQSIKVGELSYDNIELLDSGKSLVLAVAVARGALKTAEEEAAEAAEEAQAAEDAQAAEAETKTPSE
ncbi:MAG: 50S ribosomal protein L25/general stress protein Ctc [Bacteroidales bacterium]